MDMNCGKAVFYKTVKYNRFYSCLCKYKSSLNVRDYILQGRHYKCTLYSTLRYNEFDFFLKMKNTDPVMGAKLKSKTHLQITFCYFLSRVLSIWLQSLQKVLR
jgi:hypothetical protein